MEAADRSVSLDLMMRSLPTIGATATDIAKWIKRAETARAASSRCATEYPELDMVRCIRITYVHDSKCTVDYAMPPLKTERFELRLDENILTRIDHWRSQQGDVPARAEAMRRLVETGLARSSPEVIAFRPADKLILAMLADLYKHLQVNGEIDAELVMSALYSGHYWALNWQAPGMPTHLFHNNEDKKEDVTFVVDVLDMWDFIETAFRKLPKHDKNRIAAEVDGPFGEHVRFLGFDAHSQNSESGLLHIAEFIVEKLGSFKSTFGGRDLDSHIPMADKYRRMIRVFEPIRRTLIGTMLSTDQLIKVLNAAKGEAGAE